MFEERIITFDGSPELVDLVGATILTSSNDYAGVHHAARALAEDFGRVTKGDASPFQIIDENRVDGPRLSAPSSIIVGSIDSCQLLQGLERSGQINTDSIRGRWESFITSVVQKPFSGCEKALVIAGSDKRGAIFGAYTLSSQIGVSP